MTMIPTVTILYVWVKLLMLLGVLCGECTELEDGFSVLLNKCIDCSAFSILWLIGLGKLIKSTLNTTSNDHCAILGSCWLSMHTFTYCKDGFSVH